MPISNCHSLVYVGDNVCQFLVADFSRHDYDGMLTWVCSQYTGEVGADSRQHTLEVKNVT